MTDRTIIAPLGPQRVGKYMIRAELGAGGMGVVYDAHDPDLDRFVAVKTIHRHLIDAAGGADWLARFSREARAAGRVLHPNLVAIFDYLEQDGLPFLVMERIDAQTLEDRAAMGVPLKDLGGMFTQILDGLSAIHAAGVIHRDVKPANVMITDTGQVKITDFGIARITTMNRTGAGAIGTPAYMAPEQFANGAVDARADVYATGVMLYELLTGQPPYPCGGVEAVLRAQKGQAVTPPSQMNAHVSGALDALVLKAIAADPAHRFASASDMRAALTAATNGQAATRVSPAGGALSPRLSATTLTGLEQSLVAHIGPIGQIVARRAVATAVNHDDLMAQILAEVSDAGNREILRREMTGVLRTETAAVDGFAQADLDAISALLTPYLGPVAHKFVAREAQRSASRSALLTSLCASIPNASERAAFRAAAEKGHPHV